MKPKVQKMFAYLVVGGFFLALALNYWTWGKPRPSVIWYYDLGSSKVFSSRHFDIPPFIAPSGCLSPPDLITGSQSGVRAVVDTTESPPRIRLLWTYDVATRDKLIESRKNKSSETFALKMWVRRLQDPQWVRADSAEGVSMQEEAYKHANQ